MTSSLRPVPHLTITTFTCPTIHTSADDSLFLLVTSPLGGSEVLWWVCLFVCCLSVCMLIYLENRAACCLWLTALWYVMYFRFHIWRHVFIPWCQRDRIKNDVVFRSQPGGGTSWMSDNCSVWLSSADNGTGVKSTIYNCLVFTVQSPFPSPHPQQTLSELR